MSDLETLKAQHPELCFNCGAAKAWCSARDGRCIPPPAFALLSSFAYGQASIIQQHEATIAELRRELGPIRYDWEGAHDRLDALGILMGTPSLGEHLHKRLDALIADRESISADLAAAQATIQQQARELEEALEQAVERLIGKYSPKCNSFFFERDEIRSAILGVHSARAQQAEAKKEE